MKLSDVVPPEALGGPRRAPPIGAGRVDVDEELVRPGSTEEVSRVLAWASRERVRVVPVGTGGHLPPVVGRERAVVLLSTERLAGMERYEAADLTFTAGAGTRLSSLTEVLGAEGQWLPFDPPGFAERSLGGLVASGVSGPLASGYGELRNHVLGATTVFGDGRVVRLGGRVVKNVAGFDLLRPLVGSQGSLAVLTSVCMRVFPVPEVDRVLVCEADGAGALLGAVRALQTAPVLPAAAVLLVEESGRARLLVRLHGAPATVDADQRALEHHAEVRFEARDGGSTDALELRRAMSEHPEAGSVGVATVLPGRLPEALRAIADVLGGALHPPALAAELFGARVRFALGGVEALPELCRRLEVLGGSLGLERLAEPGDLEAAALAVSRPSSGERALADRVRSVYDPTGVFRARAPAAPAGVGA